MTQRDVSQRRRSHPTPLERQLAAFSSLQRPNPALFDIISEASRSATALGQHVQEAFASLQRPNPALLDIVSAASNSLSVLSQYAESLVSLARQRIVSQVAPILDRYLNDSALVRVMQPLLRHIEELYGPGTFLGDVVLVTDSEYPDAERLEALERLANKWFRNPIHPARWRLAVPELHKRAHEHGTSIGAELRAATVQAIPLALADVDEETLLSDYLSRVRAALANRLMDDLAAAEWRRRGRGAEVRLEEERDGVLNRLDVEYEAEVKATFEAFRRLVADLPRSQRDAILARIE